jgi:hypothetical protein
LKIRRKWCKNRKISNEDVMESLWVDLCSMCIILYVLVEKSCFRFLSILVRVKFISVVVLLQLQWITIHLYNLFKLLKNNILGRLDI